MAGTHADRAPETIPALRCLPGELSGELASAEKPDIFQQLSHTAAVNPSVMEPFSPQDPLGKLLGQARSVEPRPNFTQNVLRAVRQLPQRMSLGERLAEWCASFSRPALAGACAVVAAGLLALQTVRHENGIDSSLSRDGNSLATVEDASDGETDVATTLDNMNQLSTLLAQTDARAMTDTEVAFLVY